MMTNIIPIKEAPRIYLYVPFKGYTKSFIKKRPQVILRFNL